MDPMLNVMYTKYLHIVIKELFNSVDYFLGLLPQSFIVSDRIRNHTLCDTRVDILAAARNINDMILKA